MTRPGQVSCGLAALFVEKQDLRKLATNASESVEAEESSSDSRKFPPPSLCFQGECGSRADQPRRPSGGRRRGAGKAGSWTGRAHRT